MIREESIREDVWNFAIHCMELGYGVGILKQYTASEAMAKLEKFKKLEQAPFKDMISKQAVDGLKSDIMSWINSDNRGNADYFIVDKIEELVKGFNPPPANPKETEWIPIKTRPLTEKEKAEMGTESPYMYDCPLPDDGEEVEVTTYSGDVAMDNFCRDPEGCYFEHYCDDGDVLAWRHKPEPYRAESEDAE